MTHTELGERLSAGEYVLLVPMVLFADGDGWWLTYVVLPFPAGKRDT